MKPTQDRINTSSVQSNTEMSRLIDLNDFKSIFDHAAIGVALVNTDGRILKVNHSFEGLIDYTQEELQQMTFPEFTHPEDVDKDIKNYEMLIQDVVKNYQMEKRYIKRNGESIWVHLSVSLVRNDKNEVKHAVAVVQNIDKSKKQEIELRAYNARVEKAFQGAKEAVFHWPNVEDDKLWWSPNFQTILGYSKEELPSRVSSFFEIIHPKDKEIVEIGLKKLFEKNIPYRVDYRLKTKNGKYKWFHATGSVERDSENKPTEMIGFVADIDHLKKSENILKNRNKALEISNNELETFAYVASHDLQEPLRTIRSFIQLFKYSLTTELSKESESYLERVSIASDRMRGLIQDLLSYSRINIKEFSPARVDTRELVSVVLSDLTTRIHESKAVVLCEGALPVHGEYNILYRLFKNLIVNAIKFVSSDTSPVIKIKSFKNGNRVCFTIEDNGIGIPEEYRETVFEIFKRLHARNEYEGSGIGLSVCKKIIELHNGSISIDSNPDGGTSVSFDLPKTKQE